MLIKTKIVQTRIAAFHMLEIRSVYILRQHKDQNPQIAENIQMSLEMFNYILKRKSCGIQVGVASK